MKKAGEFAVRYLFMVLSTLGVLLAFGFLLEYLEGMVTYWLTISLGSGAVLFTAVVGTPIHEFAHFLGCKIFGFKVHEVKFLRPIEYKNDGMLGYVSYSFDSTNPWHKLGCAFTGMAPMIFGVVFIFIAVRLITPEVYNEIVSRVKKVMGVDAYDLDRVYKKKKNPFKTAFMCWWGAVIGFFKGLFKLRKFGIVRGIICVYVVMSISMHMTVSSVDLKGALSGFIMVLVVYLVVTLISMLLKTDYRYRTARNAAFVTAVLSIGALFDALLLLVAMILAAL